MYILLWVYGTFELRIIVFASLTFFIYFRRQLLFHQTTPRSAMLRGGVSVAEGYSDIAGCDNEVVLGIDELRLACDISELVGGDLVAYLGNSPSDGYCHYAESCQYTSSVNGFCGF